MRVLRHTLDTRETQQLAYPVRIMGAFATLTAVALR